jgi:hypothetical protein
MQKSSHTFFSEQAGEKFYGINAVSATEEIIAANIVAEFAQKRPLFSDSPVIP